MEIHTQPNAFSRDKIARYHHRYANFIGTFESYPASPVKRARSTRVRPYLARRSYDFRVHARPLLTSILPAVRLIARNIFPHDVWGRREQ